MIGTNAPVRTVAIVGIDGSGKSTLARILGERMGPSCAAVPCLRNHLIPDAPLQNLSRALEKLSKNADRLGSHQLKLTALYLQLCLFGPTHRFYVQAFAPDVVITDRHPIVDAAVYLPVLRHMVVAGAKPLSTADVDSWLESIGGTDAGMVRSWAQAQGRRTAMSTEIELIATELVELFDRSQPDLLKIIATSFQAEPPDVVFFLDVGVDTALARIAARADRELHETELRLQMVRTGYQRVLSDMQDTLIHRIHVDPMSADDVADVALELIMKRDSDVLPTDVAC